MKPQGVSIIICCHNSMKRLPETIRHIARQQVPSHIPWELLIIDNRSTDHTAAVASDEWKKLGLDIELRVVREPVLGLSYARAKGFQEARYEYIIMCDDDNWLDEHYVASAFHILSAESKIGALGGIGTLAFEIDPPVPELSYVFAGGAQAARSGKAKENKLYGAGCVIRYSAYENLLGNGFKSLLTDRRGAELTSGGDYELCLAIAILGYDIWYDERLRFRHFITQERLTWEYFLQYAYESSKSFNVISSYKMVASNGRISQLPWLAVFRNFLVCSRIFAGINIKRLFANNQYLRKSMYFRHLIFKYKLMAYFVKFPEMVGTHRLILDFQHRLQAVAQGQTGPESVAAPSLKLSFFSKLFRQLQ